MIVIDCREHTIIRIFRNFKIVCESRQLDVGDFQIFNNDNLAFIIERKTLEDFVSSIRDDRINTETAKMYAMAREFPGVKNILLIETPRIPKANDVVGHVRGYMRPITYLSVQKKITELSIMMDMMVIFTASEIETVRYLKKLDDLPPRELNTIKHYDNYRIVFSTPREYALRCWQSLPGIGPKTAARMLTQQSLETKLMLGSNDDRRRILSALPGIGAVRIEGAMESLESLPKNICDQAKEILRYKESI